VPLRITVSTQGKQPASFAETPLGGMTDGGFGRDGSIERLQCHAVMKNVSQLTA
jgi:hypothetical protein